MAANGHTTKPRFTDSQAGANPADKEPEGPEAAKRLMQHWAELREYGAYLLEVKADLFKHKLRSILANAALGVLGLMAGFAVILISVWQLLSGIAGGLGELLDDRLWLGNLVTGLAFLAVIGIGISVGLGRWQSASREATVEKYEQRKRRQKSQFGRDVQDAAGARPPNR